MKEITGTIVDVRFTSPTFSAGVLKSEKQENIDFRGKFPAVRGDEVTLVGSWSKYKGRPQFEAKNVLRNLNLSEEGLARYLANNPAFVGLGPVKARRIAEKFGKEFGTVIVENPVAVANAGSISIEAAHNIRAEWVRNQVSNAAASELSAFGLTHHQVQALIDKYGHDAVSIIKSDPFMIVRDIPRYGYKRVDAIARKIGIAKDFPPRIRAGIIDCVDTALDKGHTWIEESDLIEQANKLLVMDALNSRDIIEHELDGLIKAGKLACDSHDGRWLVARKDIHAMEREVEAFLKSGDQDNPHVFDLLGIWQKVRDGELCPDLNPKQREAIVVALTHQISTISGGGGSGKTFTVGDLTKLYESLGFKVVLCAPTGKAAKRLEQVVGTEAFTIHRLLGFNGREWAKGPDDLIDANVVIVDESSMVDIALAWRLLRSIDHEHTAVVFVGDHNQLPPVGPGDLLRDLIHTGIVPGVVLTDIVRQAGELRQNSIDVLSGKVAKTSESVLSSGRRPWYRIDNFTDAWDVRRLVCDLYETVLADSDAELLRMDKGTLNSQINKAVRKCAVVDLEGLFVRLGYAIDSIGAKRVVLDTIETLFSGLSNTIILRAELGRLFRWLKDKGVTAIITGESGEYSLTRYGLEEYVADCVIQLDNRVDGQMATRRLRIVKYRGSTHGTNEYPFLIDEGGISILPITSMGLKHEADTERVSSGIPRLDAMMGGKGYYRGSSVLVSGTAGSGKTSLAAHFANSAASRGERCLWFAFEESASQIIRNMRSIGIDLEPAVRRGTLLFHAERPANCGLEMHLVTIHKLVNQFKPRVVIIDPITNFVGLGSEAEIKAMLTRLIDFYKEQRITAMITSLTAGGSFVESTDVGVSSLMDTWLLLRDVQNGAERNRLMHLLKSRGMAHSNQVREFLLTDRGVELRDVYVGPSGGLLTGSARDALEAEEKAQVLVRKHEIEGKNRELEGKRQAMEARIAALRAEFEVEQAEAAKTFEQDQTRKNVLADDRVQMAHLRQSDAAPSGKTPKHKSRKSS